VKHFLRLLFIGSVLFVLLGLFSDTQNHSDPGISDPDGIEQVAQQAGILSHPQKLPFHISFLPEALTSGQSLTDIRKFKEEHSSNLLRSQLVRSDCIYEDIKCDLLHRKGLLLHHPSRKEIGS